MKFDPANGIGQSVVIPAYQGSYGSYRHEGMNGVKTILYRPSWVAREDAAREAEIGILARNRESPNLVASFGWQDYGAKAEIEMAHAGERLDTFLSSYPITIPSKFHLVSQVALGLTDLHSWGIAHCDLNPRNIFVDRDGVRYIARIGDFGASGIKDDVKAREAGLHEDLRTAITLDSLFGSYSPDWCAPEQEIGQACLASDVYNLAHVSAFILNGGREGTRNTAYFDAAQRNVLMHAATLPVSKGRSYFAQVEDLFTLLYKSFREPSLRPSVSQIANQAKRVESVIQDFN